MIAARARLGQLEPAVSRRLELLAREGFVERLWAKDPTLWSAEPVPELADRLGWLDLPVGMTAGVEELERLAREARDDDICRVILLGMGGSSLAPEVFSRVLPQTKGFPHLEVMDSTHPDAVLGVDDDMDPGSTLFIVASKSGGTVETLSLYRFFWQRLQKDVEQPGRHVLAVTDPGSALDTLGETRRFRAVVTAPPDVGGRFSALSVFGLVPAALMGADLRTLLGEAETMAGACRREPNSNPGVWLGAVLGEAALAGRNKLTLLPSPGLTAFPVWLEQLVAESTGKDGRGIVPIPREPVLSPASVGPDRVFVTVSLAEEEDTVPRAVLDQLAAAGHPVVELVLPGPSSLGGEMFRWEVATAVAGAILDIHPFNQPDVQLAKELAKRALAGDLEAPDTGCRWDDSSLGERIDELVRRLGPDSYLAIQAFLAPSETAETALLNLETTLRNRGPCPVTLGYGPRFLHSTGQLHKGGPDQGVFLQLVDDPVSDVPIPETGPSFRRLVRAQADGDLGALLDRRRPVLRVELGSRVEAALEQLISALSPR